MKITFSDIITIGLGLWFSGLIIALVLHNFRHTQQEKKDESPTDDDTVPSVHNVSTDNDSVDHHSGISDTEEETKTNR